MFEGFTESEYVFEDLYTGTEGVVAPTIMKDSKLHGNT
jgi:hypothetical protein